MNQSSNRPEDLAIIANSIQKKLETSIHTINDISERTHVISINSRIEAARVGEQGKGFKIVAQEFSKLNSEIATVANSLEEEIREELVHLKGISEAMAKDVRAKRLSQIGISVMDVIDRNLYERSCDVRWWATDASVVKVLEISEQENTEYASERLGIILDSYTVYLDIVVADMTGKVLANGRPSNYSSMGKNVSKSEWFKRAIELNNGTEYAMESTHIDPLVNNESILTYSCIVKESETNANLGVLGIFFNWESLVKAVFGRLVHQDLNEDFEISKIATEIWIIDEDGRILANLDGKGEGKILSVNCLNEIIESKDQGYKINKNKDFTEIIAWGYSPGFETYHSYWYCVIRQEFDY